jgi:hypothetical protein
MIRRPSKPRSLLPALAVCCVALLAGCGSTQISKPQRQRSNLLSILQDDGMLQSNPAATLADVRALGVEAVRTNVFWAQLAPAPNALVRPAFDAGDPAAYSNSGWAIYDEIVRDAAADGVQVYFTIMGRPPLWAAGPGRSRRRNCSGGCAQWEPSAPDFGAFVHALGARYSGHYIPAGATGPLPRVDFWSIWNEPNYGPNLAPQVTDRSSVEVSPRLYRNLLDAAWSALLATGHGPSSDTILIGETAPRGVLAFGGMVPLRFIRALYCVDQAYAPLRGSAATLRGCPASAAGSARFVSQNPALFEASGFADHPYPQSFAPNVPTPDEPDYADFASLPNLELALDRAAAAYGSNLRLPIYSTEFGYKTDPPYQGGEPMATASAFLNEAEYLSWRNPRIRSYDQYLLSDPSAGGSEFDTGLQFSNGSPKPTLAAYRMPLWLPLTRESGGKALEVWGCARPAPAAQRRTGRPQTVEIQLASAGSAHFRTLRTVTLTPSRGCYFDVDVSFPSSGVMRLAWSGSGILRYSRGQRITLS